MMDIANQFMSPLVLLHTELIIDNDALNRTLARIPTDPFPLVLIANIKSVVIILVDHGGRTICCFNIKISFLFHFTS